MKPIISVVVPIYNVALYLEECLESIVNQTFKEIEVICVDDGSTDESGIIADDFASKDSRFRVIHKKNTGYGNTMNIGISQATGEYLSIVESDDFISPDMLQHMYDAALIFDVQVVKCDIMRFVDQPDGKRRLLWERCLPHGWFYHRVYVPIDEQRVYGHNINVWNAIYKLDFLRNNHIIFNESPGASYQDNGFSLQVMLCISRAVFIDEPLYYNRRDNPSSSVHSKDKIYALYNEFNFLDEWIEKNYKNPRNEFFAGMHRIRGYFHTINRVGMACGVEFYNKFSDDCKRLMENKRFSKFLLSQEMASHLQRIIQNPDLAYEEDNKLREKYKVIFDTRKDIIIYGAGAYGRRVFDCLCILGMRLRIAYFTVTEMEKNPKEIYEVPVVRLKDLDPVWHDKGLVIVAVKPGNEKTLISELEKQGFNDYVFDKNLFDTEQARKIG